VIGTQAVFVGTVVAGDTEIALVDDIELLVTV